MDKIFTVRVYDDGINEVTLVRLNDSIMENCWNPIEIVIVIDKVMSYFRHFTSLLCVSRI